MPVEEVKNWPWKKVFCHLRYLKNAGLVMSKDEVEKMKRGLDYKSQSAVRNMTYQFR